MASENGESSQGPLELQETLYIESHDGKELAFEVVGILEDPDEETSYAVLMHDPADGNDTDPEFIVTDLHGNLIESDKLAQEILDEFLVFTEEGSSDGGESP